MTRRVDRRSFLRTAARAGVAAIAAASVGVGATARPGTAAAQAHSADGAARELTTPLVAGWNLVGSIAPETPASDALQGIGGILMSAFTWDAERQEFRRYSPDLPPALNSLTRLNSGDGLWLLASAPGQWTQDDGGDGGQSVSLRGGFNLVTWMGADGTGAAEAFSGLSSELVMAFTWEAARQRFHSYAAGRPSFLNDLTARRFGDGVWLELRSAVRWEQAGGSAGPVGDHGDGTVVEAGCGNEIGNGAAPLSGPTGPQGPDNDSVFRALAVDPTDPDIVLLGTERNGFVRSLDGGQSWTRERFGLRTMGVYAEIWDIAFAPTAPTTILAATLDSPGPVTGNAPSTVGGIYKSIDGGATWQRKNCGFPTSRITSIQFDTTDPLTAVAGLEGGFPSYTGATEYFPGGIFLTRDGGETWTRVDGTATGERNGYTILRAYGRDPTRYLTFGMNRDDLSQNVGFLQSPDGGASWQALPNDPFRTGEVQSFDISPDGSVIYVSPVDQFRHWVSRDGGATWTQTAINQANGPVALSPGNPNVVIYGSQQRLYRSTNGLATSAQVGQAPQPPGHFREAPFQDIVFAPSDPTIVYAATEGYLVYRSNDAGASWTLMANVRRDVLNAIP